MKNNVECINAFLKFSSVGIARDVCSSYLSISSSLTSRNNHLVLSESRPYFYFYWKSHCSKLNYMRFFTSSSACNFTLCNSATTLFSYGICHANYLSFFTGFDSRKKIMSPSFHYFYLTYHYQRTCSYHHGLLSCCDGPIRY